MKDFKTKQDAINHIEEFYSNENVDFLINQINNKSVTQTKNGTIIIVDEFGLLDEKIILN